MSGDGVVLGDGGTGRVSVVKGTSDGRWSVSCESHPVGR